MNNSIFGKAIENVRKRRDITCTTFSDHLMAIEMRKTDVLMDKPIQAILNKSKELMYEFWYEYLKPKYRDKLKLFIVTY